MSDKKRTSVEYTEEDQRMIENLRRRFGFSSDIEAVRFSLRVANDTTFLNVNQQDTYAEGHQQHND